MRALKNTIEKKKTRIILSIPPRHGKSQIASIYFPAWALGLYPELKFILTTYGAELSEDIGMKTRDVIASEAYGNIFPNTQLREDTKSKAKWMTKDGGSYTAVGIGGAITGKGGDCVIPYCTIETNRGIIPIADVVPGDMVLGYDHKTNKKKWTTVRAVSAKKTKESIIKIGNLYATESHKIYTEKGGYIRAKDIREEDLLYLSRKESLSRNRLQKMLRKRQGILFNRNEMSDMSQDVYKEKVGNCKGSITWVSLHVLQQRLLQYIQKKFTETEQIHRKVYSLFKSLFRKKEILFKKMLPSFQIREQRRNVISRILVEIKNKCCGKGQKDMLIVRENKGSSTRSPFRWRLFKQQVRKHGDTVYGLSQVYPQSIESSPRTIAKLYGWKNYVVDIQTDTHNFFCEGVLVHNCIIIDDPHKDRASAESETDRKTVWDYYRSTLYSRLEGFGTIIVIMQRWRQDDLVGLLLEEDEKIKKEDPEKAENWEVINFPAIAEEDEFNSEGIKLRSKGEALWPSKYPIEFLSLIRQQSPYFWSSQYQQNPIAQETAEFKKEYFRYYEQADLAGKYLRYYTIVDPAISQKKSADNTVVLTLAKEVNGPNIYRIKETAKKMTPSQTVDEIFSQQAEFRSEVWIETVAYQAALKFMIEEERRKRGQFFVLYELKSQTKKEERIRGLLGLYQSGVIFHLPTADLDYEYELLAFPNGKHDDRIDAMAYLLQAVRNTNSSNTVKQFKPKWLSYGKKAS